MFILDTNVISELRKIRLGKADKYVEKWADSVNSSDLYLSVITVQELEIGILLIERKAPNQGAVLRTWLINQVYPAFEHRILPVNKAVAIISAKLHIPDPKPVRDTLIAATALIHGMSVVTRNTKDFESSGVPLLNPWIPKHGNLTE